MRSTAIYIKTEEETKEQAQKIAKDLGLSLSAVMNRLLKQFIRTKTVTFRADDEIPNEQTRKALAASEADYKAGRYISFKSIDEVRNYISSMIKDEKYKERLRR